MLEQAFAGSPAGGFDDHHRFLRERMLGRVDAIDADSALVDAQIETHLAPATPGRSDRKRPIGVTPAA